MTTFKKLVNRPLISNWPAWGVLDIGYVEELQTRIVPKDWKPDGNGNQYTEWIKYRTKTIAQISEVLWPAYDFVKFDFPPSRHRQMHELTAADLSISLDFQAEKPFPFEQPIQSPLATANPSTHRTFFLREDEQIESLPGQFHSEYDATLTSAELSAVTEQMTAGLSDKTDTAAAQFKKELQRPRGLQMSLAFGAVAFRHEPAHTAYSPSMISGHALQGLIMGCTVIDSWLLNRTTLNPESFEAMQQYATDIGDRRFMAGVHYPSDSIASWIVALSTANNVYQCKATKVHMWRAIQKSLVYRKVTAFKEANVYEKGLALIHSLAPPAM